MENTMKKKPKAGHPSWCYDVRSGWSEVEDVVLAASADRAKIDAALSETGFSSTMLAFANGPIECTVHSNTMGRRPEYYVEMKFPGNTESLYVANLPSLLALLRDLVPIFQAGPLADTAGFLQAQRRGRRRQSGPDDGPIAVESRFDMDKLMADPQLVELAQALALRMAGSGPVQPPEQLPAGKQGKAVGEPE
jgi:hypothetical protein